MACRKRVEKEYLVLTDYRTFSSEIAPKARRCMENGTAALHGKGPGAMLRRSHEMEPKIRLATKVYRLRGARTWSNR